MNFKVVTSLRHRLGGGSNRKLDCFVSRFNIGFLAMTKYLVLFLLLSIFSPHKIFSAETGFLSDYDVSYTFSESGTASVQNKITITNRISHLYAESFSLHLGRDIGTIKAFDETGVLQTRIEPLENDTQVTVVFPAPIAGFGKKRSFVLEFEMGGLVHQIGEMKEVSIPPIRDLNTINSYHASLMFPPSWGIPSGITPVPLKNYEWEFANPREAGIFVVFGTNQQYQFTLWYTLTNEFLAETQKEISIPPDTSFQKVQINTINPKPLRVRRDTDGNWLAVYQLKSGEEKNIKVEGVVTIFLTPQESNQAVLTQEEKENYVKAQPFWEITDPLLLQKARNLKNPAEIYDFVVHNFSYGYDRLNQNDVVRKGASYAFANPHSLLCMEFSDLFVAFARASGIPSRVVSGYAATNNQTLRPLSLTNDVLHAWPEYYDEKQNLWISVDPTWGATTGIDYFTARDLSHVAFVINGSSSTQPLTPGSFRTEGRAKDISISPLSHNVDFNSPDINVYFRFNPDVIEIKNTGTVSYFTHQISLTAQKTPVSFTTPPESITIPPLGSVELPFVASFSGIENDTLTLSLGNEPYTYVVSNGWFQKGITSWPARFFLAGLLFFGILMIVQRKKS